MNREEKAAAVAELSEQLKEAQAVFAIDYRGISVTESAELRGKLTEADAVFKVVKNRLAKLAAADAGTEGMDELLVGPTALTLIHGDAVLAAKAISDFAKEYEKLEYKGGLMDGSPLDPDGFKQIARLPGVDTLRGQLVGLTASPLTGLAAAMNNLLSGLGRQLSQIAEQGLLTGEAPAGEAPAEEAPAEEAAEEAPEGEETSNEEEAGGGEDAPSADETDANPDAPGSEAEEAAGTDSDTENEAASSEESGEDESSETAEDAEEA